LLSFFFAGDILRKRSGKSIYNQKVRLTGIVFSALSSVYKSLDNCGGGWVLSGFALLTIE
jgi:hypothetical protein